MYTTRYADAAWLFGQAGLIAFGHFVELDATRADTVVEVFGNTHGQVLAIAVELDGLGGNAFDSGFAASGEFTLFQAKQSHFALARCCIGKRLVGLHPPAATMSIERI